MSSFECEAISEVMAHRSFQTILDAKKYKDEPSLPLFFRPTFHSTFSPIKVSVQIKKPESAFFKEQKKNTFV